MAYFIEFLKQMSIQLFDWTFTWNPLEKYERLINSLGENFMMISYLKRLEMKASIYKKAPIETDFKIMITSNGFL